MFATAAAERLIHDEALRAIERQQAAAAEVRASASLLIATAAIAISLLDHRAFENGAATVCALVALAGFLLVSVSALAVTWPREDLPIMRSPVSMLTAAAGSPISFDADAVRRNLITQMEVQQWLMARRNAVLSRVFRLGGFGLLLQLTATVATRFLTT